MICKKKSCAIKSSRKYREIYFCLRLPQHKTYSQKKNVYRIECEGGGEPEENIEPAAKRRKVIGELSQKTFRLLISGVYIFHFIPPSSMLSVNCAKKLNFCFSLLIQRNIILHFWIFRVFDPIMDSVHIKSWSIQQAPLILYDVYHSLRHHFI